MQDLLNDKALLEAVLDAAINLSDVKTIPVDGTRREIINKMRDFLATIETSIETSIEQLEEEF